MKKKLLLSAAVTGLAMTGVTIDQRNNNDTLGVPFFNPVLMTKAVCGDPDDLANRRAFFLKIAGAYAETLEPAAGGTPSLYAGFSHIGVDVTTAKPEAQSWFNQGVGFTYNFNHEEAIEAFRHAQKIDPDCAMCYWGEAFALGPNINAPMIPEAYPVAFAAIEKAKAASGVSDKEREMIEALALRYTAQPLEDRSALDNAFADAMDALSVKYPEDDFLATLSAEANMDSQPWDYWEAGGRTPKGRTARTISLLEGVMARNPANPAAIHLYIHITEASDDPFRAAAPADRLAALTPNLGHLIHMPSHTYFRVGRFKDSIKHNIKAVEADEAYLAMEDEASVIYEFGYYTHNVHFLMTSAQMAGDGATALAMAKKLDAKLPAAMAAAVPFAQPIKAAPYYTMVQFGDPQEILELESPSDELPLLKGAWHYARGEAFAKLGDAEKAEGEAAAIAGLLANEDFSVLEGFGIPAVDILTISRLTVSARAADAGGDVKTAIEAFEEAAEIQAGIAYTEPPYWYYPVTQSLAAMLLKDGQNQRAEQVFIETLAASPNNAWALGGLAETYKQQGDKNAAKYAHSMFKDAWLGKGKKIDINHM